MGDLLDEILGEMSRERNLHRVSKFSEKDKTRWKINSERRDAELARAKIKLATVVGEFIRNPTAETYNTMKKEWANYNNRFVVGRKKS